MAALELIITLWVWLLFMQSLISGNLKGAGYMKLLIKIRSRRLVFSLVSRNPFFLSIRNKSLYYLFSFFTLSILSKDPHNSSRNGRNEVKPNDRWLSKVSSTVLADEYYLLVNTPYMNGVTLREQNLSLKSCQCYELKLCFKEIWIFPKRGTLSYCRSKGCKVADSEDSPIVQDSNL